MTQMLNASSPPRRHIMDFVTGVIVITGASVGSVLLVQYLFFF
jgi:hypothetical protein